MKCSKFSRDLLYVFYYYLALYSFHSKRTQLPTAYYCRIIPYLRYHLIVCNMVRFSGEELLVPVPNSKLEDHPLSDYRDSLFNVLATVVCIKILQFHYLLLLPVAHSDERYTVSFPRSFHREYVPS